jgi:dTDP-4-dehydrorhamnose reductase
MRLAISGSKGQLGRVLERRFGHDHDLLLIDLPEADITDPASIIPLIADFRPDVVIHGAALTDVDGCARNPDLAFRINAWGTQNVALACQKSDAVMLHISTNEVFDGAATEPYREWDPLHPINPYACSKAAAERIVQALLTRFYIVRPSWLYASGGNNFPAKIIRLADTHGRLRVVADEVACPTYAPDLVDAIARLIQTNHYGIYHLVNEGHCSRYDFAARVLQLAGRPDVPIERITLADYPRASTVPPFTPLRNTCAAALGITLRPWEDALAAYFQEAS